jgi:hypothetical protein
VQGGLFAVDQCREVSEGLLGPVLGERVVLALAEVVARSVGEERLWQVQADAEATRVHRRLQHCPGCRAAPLIAVQQHWRSGEVLGEASVGAGACEGVGQQPVTVFGKRLRRGQMRGIEGVRDRQGAAGKEFSYPAVRVCLARQGQGRVLID